ncbi:MAG: hypothetical protein H0U49_10635 [Parachlamydiaceae bacterium]|nr:hypothetical protein [Parachlamydiaceae bacterium]
MDCLNNLSKSISEYFSSSGTTIETVPATDDTPDYSFSWKTKVLIISTVALAAIGIAGAALILTGLTSLVGAGTLPASPLLLLVLFPHFILMAGVAASLVALECCLNRI